jgi:hypothetical protein
LKKIEDCKDEDVQTMLTQSKNPEMKIDKKGYYYKKFPIIVKFRGVNPLVLTKSGELKRLTEIDILFRNSYEQIQELCRKPSEIDRLCKR